MCITTRPARNGNGKAHPAPVQLPPPVRRALRRLRDALVLLQASRREDLLHWQDRGCHSCRVSYGITVHAVRKIQRAQKALSGQP